MTLQVRYLSSLVLYLLCLCFLARSSQANCLAKFLDLRDGGKLVTGGTDRLGNPVDIANATGMTYGLCVKTCGSGPSFRPWNIFAQRFSTWLLPFLALVSQLPFNGNSRRENLMAMFLNVGSPTLAAYSVILTALNNSWIAHLFLHISYPNARSAVRILSSLQQVPLKVNVEEALLSSLVVLPENDQWWSEFILWLDVNNIYTFSFVNLASIGWVIIAFALTVIDTFTNVVNNSAPPLNSNGLAVAFAWLWLLPVIISWLQVGSRCDSRTLHRAFRHANRNVYAATINARSVPADLVSTSHAISVARFPHSPRTNEHSPSPVNNYARIFSWTLAVDRVYVVFREASRRAEQRIPVNPISAWVKGDRDIRIHPENRRGSVDQVAAYTGDTYEQNSTDCIHSAVFRIVVSAFLALILTWGTIGAAMLTQWFTPTRGLSCRSGSYLVYAVISTLVWMLLVISSILTSTGVEYESQARKRSTLDVCTALRRMGETLAAINAAWIVLACIFQFIGLYDTCWCTSSAFSLGSRAYSVAILTRVEISELWPAVVGGTILACGSVLLFFGAVNILLDTHLPL
ncbi:hypothetical protein C8J57DRAFT_479257 [Mycena rebaudengoi]|nr:hypothetical protein C8J57DRAFT_479257 [Mycena rebaudengoi]